LKASYRDIDRLRTGVISETLLSTIHELVDKMVAKYNLYPTNVHIYKSLLSKYLVWLTYKFNEDFSIYIDISDVPIKFRMATNFQYAPIIVFSDGCKSLDYALEALERELEQIGWKPNVTETEVLDQKT